MTIYFRANVAPLLRGRNLSVIYVNNSSCADSSGSRSRSIAASWRSTRSAIPHHPVADVSTGLTDERCLEFVRVALGVRR